MSMPKRKDVYDREGAWTWGVYAAVEVGLIVLCALGWGSWGWGPLPFALAFMLIPSGLIYFGAMEVIFEEWIGGKLLGRTQAERWRMPLVVPNRPERILFAGPGGRDAYWVTLERYEARRIVRENLEFSCDGTRKREGALVAAGPVTASPVATRPRSSPSCHGNYGPTDDVPFADEEFDLVVVGYRAASVPTLDARRDAVAEMWRLIAAGGTLLIHDLMNVRDYPRVVAEATGVQPQVFDIGWDKRLIWPWKRARVLAAIKPS